MPFRAKSVEIDSDTLRDLGCNSNQVARWNGSAWVCAEDIDTTYSGTDFAVSNQSCTGTQRVSGLDASGNVTCTDDSRITTNSNNISTNTSDISINTSNINANSNDIVTAQSDIGTNTGNIATNSSDITANQGSLAINSTNIATNTTDIANNTASINVLESSFNPQHPDGLSGITPITQSITSSTSYTVPIGKNLYITNIYSTAGTLSIDGIDVDQGHPPPFFVGAGTTLTATSLNIHGYLIDAVVTPITLAINATSTYTVPAGKNLFITYLIQIHGNNILYVDGFGMFDGHVSSNTPIIVGAGQVVSSTNTVINGYLRDQ